MSVAVTVVDVIVLVLVVVLIVVVVDNIVGPGEASADFICI